MSFLIFTCLIIILSSVYFYLKKKLSYWHDRNVFSIKPSFPMGNFKDVGKKINWAHKLSEIYTKFKGKDLFCGVYFMTSPQVLITDLDLIKLITIKDFNNFVDRGMYYHETADPLSAHLFNIEGEKWKNIRKKLSPTFTSGKIKMMYETVLDVSGDLITLVSSFADSKEVLDMKDICMRYTADVIGSCAFGLECNSLKSKNSELLIVAKTVFDFRSPLRQLKFFFQSTFINIARFFNLRLVEVETAEYFFGIITDTIEHREINQIKRNDFMNLLIQIHKYGKIQDDHDSENVGKITFNELAAQAFVFFFAGFETSSTAMNFCLFELANNQDIQNKVRNEINKLQVKHNGKLSYEVIMECEYLGQVINETLRKYSPVNTLYRQTLNDYKVPGTSHIIEKNIKVMIPVYSIHNDPEIYPNPSKFDPDRFSIENIKQRHPYSFLPFGEGPRNCIGKRFAILQTRLGLARMIINFKFTVNSKTLVPVELDPTDLAFVMTAKGGIWLNVEKI